MGCLCSSSESNSLPKIQPRSLGKASFLASAISASINNERLSMRFTEQSEKLKSIRSAFERYLENSRSSAQELQLSLENFDLPFTRKSFEDMQYCEEDVECPVCFCIFDCEENKAVELKCGHVICMSCVLEKRTGDVFICSLDNISTNVSPEEIAQNMMLSEKGKAIKHNLFCFTHRTIANKVCITCKQIVCSDCLKKDHERHNVYEVSDKIVGDEMLTWEKTLGLYIKKLNESKKEVCGCSENFARIGKEMNNVVEKHVEQVNISRERVIETLNLASQVHIEMIKGVKDEMCKNMPLKILDLYENCLQQEIEKAQSFFLEFKDLSAGDKLKNVLKINLGNQNKLRQPNNEPWEKTCSTINEMVDYEALVLALASIPNN